MCRLTFSWSSEQSDASSTSSHTFIAVCPPTVNCHVAHKPTARAHFPHLPISLSDRFFRRMSERARDKDLKGEKDRCQIREARKIEAKEARKIDSLPNWLIMNGAGYQPLRIFTEGFMSIAPFTTIQILEGFKCL